MANQQNIRKLLSTLGGASEGYGTFQKVGGQPLLPKPQMSMPDALSPYAPGNQQGGPQAGLGALTGGDPDKPGSGAKTPQMQNSSHHPAAQLAQYLMSQEGRSPSARLKSSGVDPGAFIRGAQ